MRDLESQGWTLSSPTGSSVGSGLSRPPVSVDLSHYPTDTLTSIPPTHSPVPYRHTHRHPSTGSGCPSRGSGALGPDVTPTPSVSPKPFTLSSHNTHTHTTCTHVHHTLRTHHVRNTHAHYVHFKDRRVGDSTWGGRCLGTSPRLYRYSGSGTGVPTQKGGRNRRTSPSFVHHHAL